jgi:EAL domain-containing protein (putative c-di-GMP-specific phosphodiesterase class I)
LTGNNARADAIFKAVIGLGAALSVPVLAEGVETEQQLQFAHASGCEELQGFHFGRPVPESIIDAMYVSLNGNLTLTSIQSWQEVQRSRQARFRESDAMLAARSS